MPQTTRINADQLFKMLSDRVYDVYCQLHELLSKWLTNNKDVTQDVDLRQHYIYIMQFADRISAVLEMLSNGDAEEKARFIISKAKEVDDLERRIFKFNARNTSGTA